MPPGNIDYIPDEKYYDRLKGKGGNDKKDEEVEKL